MYWVIFGIGHRRSCLGDGFLCAGRINSRSVFSLAADCLMPELMFRQGIR